MAIDNAYVLNELKSRLGILTGNFGADPNSSENPSVVAAPAGKTLLENTYDDPVSLWFKTTAGTYVKVGSGGGGGAGAVLRPWDLTPVEGPAVMTVPSPINLGGVSYPNSGVLSGSRITLNSIVGTSFAMGDCGAFPDEGKFHFYYKPGPLPTDPSVLLLQTEFFFGDAAAYEGKALATGSGGTELVLADVTGSPETVDPDYDNATEPVVLVNVDRDSEEISIRTANGLFGPYSVSMEGYRLGILSYMYATATGQSCHSDFSATDDFGSGLEPEEGYENPLQGLGEAPLPDPCNNGDILYVTAPGPHNGTQYGIAENGDPDFAVVIDKATGQVAGSRGSQVTELINTTIDNKLAALPVRQYEPASSDTAVSIYINPANERGAVLDLSVLEDGITEFDTDVQLNMTGNPWVAGMKFFVSRSNADSWQFPMYLNVKYSGGSTIKAYYYLKPGDRVEFEYVNDELQWQPTDSAGWLTGLSKNYTDSEIAKVNSQAGYPLDGLFMAYTLDNLPDPGSTDEQGMYLLKADFKRKRRIYTRNQYITDLNRYSSLLQASPDGRLCVRNLPTVISSNLYAIDFRTQNTLAAGSFFYSDEKLSNAMAFSLDSKLFAVTSGGHTKLCGGVVNTEGGSFADEIFDLTDYLQVFDDGHRRDIGFAVAEPPNVIRVFLSGRFPSESDPNGYIGIAYVELAHDNSGFNVPVGAVYDPNITIATDGSKLLAATTIRQENKAYIGNQYGAYAVNNATGNEADNTGGQVFVSSGATYYENFSADRCVYDLIYRSESGLISLFVLYEDVEGTQKLAYLVGNPGSEAMDSFTLELPVLDYPHTRMWRSPDGAYIVTDGGALIDVFNPRAPALVEDHNIIPGAKSWVRNCTDWPASGGGPS